jgi:hypothetical protein
MDTAEHDPFRPRSVADMAGATGWLAVQSLTTRADPPNIVLVGAAGTGKSCALRLALGPAVVVWLRCSQDPTLRENRDRIKTAARRRSERTCWIVLEHADTLHTDAQAFLRRIIETSTGSTRFVLEVRDAAAIAEPLLSRCVLFNGPALLEYEIRAEVMRRAPTLSVEDATRFAAQCDGNVRWATLQALGLQSKQALGSGSGLGSGSVPGSGFIGCEYTAPKTWSALLAKMEEVQKTGTSPRAFSKWESTIWDRPGGIDPWSVLALELSATIG